MKTRRTPQLPRPGASASPAKMEARRKHQRAVCLQLLERWVPVATSPSLAISRESKTGPVIDEEPFEAGLKAGAYVIKVLERLAQIDGLDAAEKRELTVAKTADPLELARRVQAASPILMARLQLASAPDNRPSG